MILGVFKFLVKFLESLVLKGMYNNVTDRNDRTKIGAKIREKSTIVALWSALLVLWSAVAAL